jgi:membrane protein
MWWVLSRAGRNFVEDECPRLAAALAYYMFFALPALLVAIVFIGGSLVNNEAAVREQLKLHFEETIGATGAEQLTAILQNASKPRESWQGWLVGIAMLVVGATGALVELQTALNRAWSVKPDPAQGGVRAFFMKRVLSLGLLVAIALLLIASLMISWGLEAFGQWIDAQKMTWLPMRTMSVLHSVASVVIITVLFAALLKFLPDAQVAWADVWSGAVVTAVLFWVGQWLLGVYLGWSRPTSAYGAAGSLALVLLWIYYSGLILFFGAEFTQAMTERRGKRAAPAAGAQATVREGEREGRRTKDEGPRAQNREPRPINDNQRPIVD